MAPFGYCLNASTIRGTPLCRQIDVAAAAGYGAIELWFADLDESLAAGVTLGEIGQRLGEANLSVATMIYLGGWFDAPERDWPQVRLDCTHRLEQAAALGAKYIIACPPDGQSDIARGATRYRELLEIGKQAGALPAMEFLGFVQQFRTIESALDVIQRANHPEGTIVVDPFHIFLGGGSFDSLASIRGEQIAIAHFNDAASSPPREQQNDGDRLWPGDGHLDLQAYCRHLRRAGYAGWLSVELFREDLWRCDPLEVAQIGLEKMRAVVEA